MQEIQLIFNPGKGSVDITRITAVVGDRIGALPKPTRRGYVFTGWYLTPNGNPDAPDARRITSETLLSAEVLGGKLEDTVLFAGWRKPQGAAEAKGKNSYRTQKRAVLVIAALVVLLVAAFVVAGIVADIYRYTDVDDVVYTIKKHDGEYALFKNGALCDSVTEGTVTYFITSFGTQLRIDPETGEYDIYAMVDTEDTEQAIFAGKVQRVLMFKRLTYDQSSTSDITKVIKTIEMHNQHGTYTLKRGSNNRFVVDGHDTAILMDTPFAALANACGYTISTMRLENPERLADGTIHYAEYGLSPETRVEKDEDGNDVLDKDGNPVTYEYVPTWYTITTMSGDSYTVTIGDATVSGGGYYARYADRNTVYVLNPDNIRDAALQPIEALITPMMIYPMSMNSYFQVTDFTYRKDFDHDAITRDLILEVTGKDILSFTPDEDGKLSEEDKAAMEAITEEYSEAVDAMSDEAFAEMYNKILEKHTKLVTKFTYVDLLERENTMNASLPYQMSSEYLAGYMPNSDNIGTMLQKLYSMTFEGVTVLAPTDDELDAYGLLEYAHEFSFIYTDAEDNSFSNYFQVSEKTEDGLYYAYSPDYDMIVCFSESQAEYLEWEDIDWYEREYFQTNIAFVTTIKLEGAGLDAPIVFTLDNTKSDQSQGINSEKLEVYANGTLVDYKLMVTRPSGTVEEAHSTYNFRRFFQAMLTASMQGNAELSDEAMAALRETSDEDCLLKITVSADDGKGSTLDQVYRFYRYTERKAYMTIEVLDGPDGASDPIRATGRFYVLKSFCDKLISDAYRFLEGTEIVVDSKN